MNITADAVKQLRERTGAGMMECKKALVEANGDADVAAENMRKAGLAKADKKASRVAAEGVVVIEKSADGKTGVLVEVNSETDFVARGDEFRGFANDVARAALAAAAGSVEAVNALKLASGETVDERRRDRVEGGERSRENLAQRRCTRQQSRLQSLATLCRRGRMDEIDDVDVRGPCQQRAMLQ